jgi:hypothetical protein
VFRGVVQNSNRTTGAWGHLCRIGRRHVLERFRAMAVPNECKGLFA